MPERVKEMAQMQVFLKCELDPFNPVPEICQVIDAMIANNKLYEESILLGVKEAIEKRQSQLKKGVEQNGTK